MNGVVIPGLILDRAPSRTSMYTKRGRHPWEDCSLDSAIVFRQLHLGSVQEAVAQLNPRSSTIA